MHVVARWGGLLVFVSGVALAADADNAPRLEEACKTVLKNCRHNLTVQLRQADGTEFKKNFDLIYPPVQGGKLVTLFAGETVRLLATIEGDHITNLAPASPSDDASHTIELSLKQTPDKVDMMLVIKNPFDRMIKYSAGMQVPPGSDVIKTSVCTVMAGKEGIETWPHPVFQLILSDFELIPASGSITCD